MPVSGKWQGAKTGLEKQYKVYYMDDYYYIIYYGVIFLILIPAVLFGKRIFCHYFCWMAPFMVIGTKIRRFLQLPGLHITVKHEKDCVSCGKCNKICPMGIQVSEMVSERQVKSMECIQCGDCIDGCPQKVLSYGMIEKEKLLKLFFGNEGGSLRAISHIDVFQEKIERELSYLTEAEDILRNSLDEDDTHKYYLLTAAFGIKTYRAYLEWCEEARAILGGKQTENQSGKSFG